MAYEVLLAISVILSLIYVITWHRHFNVFFSLIFFVIPVAETGFVMIGRSRSLEEAVLAHKVVYLAGTFLPLFFMLTILELCRFYLKKRTIFILFAFCTAIYFSVLSIGYEPWFYKSVDFAVIGGRGALVNREYGFCHALFYLMLAVFSIVSLTVIIYSFVEKTEVSHKIATLLFIPGGSSILVFFGGKIALENVEVIAYVYPFIQLSYLIIVYRICFYDIDESVVDSMVQTGDTGYLSIDFKYRYLGSNETVKTIFPELSSFPVDKPIREDEKLSGTLLHWAEDFRLNEEKNLLHYESGDKVYMVNIRYLYVANIRSGFQFFFVDDTDDYKYIALLDKYNTELEEEVAKKTANIVEMHDKLIMSLAMMVESRDNSTGGHIMRTSEVVRILMDEIRKDNPWHLTDSFCKNMIKAAPMHDLGKVAVDDAILRKPGRFTEEEYEQMKKHAAEGARIVHEVLKDTDDQEFHLIAENVAHYHHERWDGSGYPDHLKGEEIPLEARIMAVADVYDALVSKRVYKEKMSFEKADAIIMDSMGKHFDKRLEKYYAAARPRLEAYYRAQE